MKHVPFFAAAAAVFAFAVPARAADVDFTDALLLRDGSLAELTASTLGSWPALAGRIRFSFQDGGTERAVWLGGNRDPRRTVVQAFDLPVYEIQAAFRPDGGTLAAMEFVLFSRGDVMQAGAGGGPNAATVSAAVHDDKAFRSLGALVQGRLEEAFGKHAGPPRKTSRVDGHDQRQFRWKTPAGEAILSVGFTKEKNGFRGEYVRVAVRPAGPADAAPPPPPPVSGPRPVAGPNEARITATRADAAANVVREPGGAVYVDNVPMVDQGDKGYCVVATLERLIRYYGGTASQHELAQLFDTGDGGGTAIRTDRFVSPEICRQFGFKQKKVEVETPDPEKLVKEYNRRAAVKLKPDKKAKRTDWSGLLAEADRNGLRAAVAETPACRKFVPAVKPFIDKGIPLVWIVPGHMRLLTGYDETDGTVFYSDSWGRGHERKTMPVAEAVLLTEALFAVQP